MPERPFVLARAGVWGHKNGIFPRTLNTPPNASFTQSADYGTVTFTDTSVDNEGSIASWDWDFGDGATSTAQDPIHTYDTDGTYSVTLTVTDDGGLSDSTTTDITVDVNESPSASFNYSKLGNGEVDFTDTSSDPESNISSYEWAFGDGSSSTSQNPTHTYGSDGNYNVTLTVTDSKGLTNSATETITVDVNDPPTASFSYTDQGSGTYDFTDTSTDDEGNITSWDWNFGDGNTSTAQNPTHTYSSSGDYTVELTVTDSYGASDSTTRTVSTDLSPQGQPLVFYTPFDSGWGDQTGTATLAASEGSRSTTQTAAGSHSLRSYSDASQDRNQWNVPTSTLDGSSDFSVSCWVWLMDHHENDAAIGFVRRSSSFALGTWSDQWAIANNADFRASHTFGTKVRQQWVHIGFSYDASTSTISCYENGTHRNDGSMSFNVTSSQVLQLGRVLSDSTYLQLEGYIDEVQMYDGALSADAMNYLYNNPGKTVDSS